MSRKGPLHRGRHAKWMISGYPAGTDREGLSPFVVSMAQDGEKKAGESHTGSQPDSVFISFSKCSFILSPRRRVEEGHHCTNTRGCAVWRLPQERVPVQAVFDRAFGAFRVDCKLPRGRDQAAGPPLGFPHAVGHRDG